MVGSLPKIDQTRAATTTTFAKTGFCSPILFYIVRRRRGRLLGRAQQILLEESSVCFPELTRPSTSPVTTNKPRRARDEMQWWWEEGGWLLVDPDDDDAGPRAENILYTCAVVECNYDTSTTAIYEWRSAAWLWGRVKWSDPIYYYCCFAFFIFSFWRRRRRASWQGDPFANNYYRWMVSFVIKTPEQQLKQSESIQGPDKDRKEIELWGCLWMRLFY